MASLRREFVKGFTSDIPIFGLFLGLCPTLAVTTTLSNAVGMGAATMFVLVASNVIISGGIARIIDYGPFLNLWPVKGVPHEGQGDKGKDPG